MLNTLGIILTGGSMSISGVAGIGIAGIANSSDNILGLSKGIENDGIKFGVDVAKMGIDVASFKSDFSLSDELQIGLIPLDGYSLLNDIFEQYKKWK